MKLKYRGVEYDYNPPMLEVTESDILGKYRGRPHHYSYVRHIPFPQPVTELKYRGVAYQTNRTGQIEPVRQPARESVFASLQSRLHALNPIAAERRQLIREAAQAHQDSIKRSLEHRIEVARAQGNAGLLKQLEDEMSQMA
ncbi:MAG: DUF4278 domain-containing protein [Leptolyngbya sp. SIO4C1]|nr:DUF4278 domain-containing protein [Leptolyngbya sp. SIO4C1]